MNSYEAERDTFESNVINKRIDDLDGKDLPYLLRIVKLDGQSQILEYSLCFHRLNIEVVEGIVVKTCGWY